MKKLNRFISIVSMVLAFLFVVETPISALGFVTDHSDEAEIEVVDDEDSESSNLIVDEIEEDRTEYSKTFLLENGNKMLVEYTIPIHYQNDQGKWIDYDNTLKAAQEIVLTKQENIYETQSAIGIMESPVVEAAISDVPQTSTTMAATDATVFSTESDNDIDSVSEDSIDVNDVNADVEDTEQAAMALEESVGAAPTEAVAVYSNKNSNLEMSFSKTASDDNMVFVGKGEHTVSWGYQDINAQIAKYIVDTTEYKGNEKFTVLKNIISTVKYQSAYENVDIELISTPVGVKENIILKQRRVQNTYVSEYNIGNLTAKQLSARVIALMNDEDEEEYYISAEYMYDAKGEKSEEIQLNILNDSEGVLTVELVADTEWLNASERVYPVTIDPSFVTGQEWSSIQSTYVDSKYSNTPHGNSPSNGNYFQLYTGKTYDIATNKDRLFRTFVQMNTIPKLNKGDMLVNATFNNLTRV